MFIPKGILFVFLFCLLFMLGCDSSDNGGGAEKNAEYPESEVQNEELFPERIIVESFASEDEPFFNPTPTDPHPVWTENHYSLLKPWNYDKAHNSERKYPLLISLAGRGGLEDYTAFRYRKELKKQYPSFVLATHISPSSTTWSDDECDWLINEIEDLIESERIDTNRIYIMGFSLGGSGSYQFANRYHSQKGRLMAGLIRFSGAGPHRTLPDEAYAKTSAWLFVGLKEPAQSRVEGVRACYDNIKNFSANSDAKENSTLDYDFINGNMANTWTLIKNDIQIAKRTEFPEVGHSTVGFTANPEVFEWLFGQSLAQR